MCLKSEEEEEEEEKKSKRKMMRWLPSGVRKEPSA
jgi:hypothetical protein